jgi:uncharacterized Zn-binding protein involved in type VI secretion
MLRLPVVLAFLLVSLFSFQLARAQWVYNGTRVCTFSASYAGAAIPDGSGGAIIVWQDTRLGDDDIYIRRINALGVPLWTSEGSPVCIQPNQQVQPVLVSDGAGGAIVAWRDERGASDDIYAQRINSTGAPTWALNGVPICTAVNIQVAVAIASDAAGGAIMAWGDARNGANYDVYARRVNAAGTPQWAPDGVPVAALGGTQNIPQVMADGAGGVFITWDDTRSGNGDIYAQRLNSAGTAQWTANGKVVISASDDQTRPQMVTDGAGGAIICWRDQRGGADDIFAQRINSAGTQLWDPLGRTVCGDPGAQTGARMVSDGAGGAVIAWEDFRSLEYDVYAQRITPSGFSMWAPDGVALTQAPDNQDQIELIPDGAQGAIALWMDMRSDTHFNVYAQRVNFNGVPMWTQDGAGICTDPNGQTNMVATGDGNGAAIAAWTDARGGAALYAQRIDPRYGYGGRPEPVIGSAVDNPSDQGGKVIVRWTASALDNFTFPGITHYSIWRSTDVAAFNAAAASAGATNDPRGVDKIFSGVAIWEEASASGPAYWEWVGNLDATYQDRYSYTAPTRQDSTIVNFATTYFKVLAHEADTPGAHIWESGSVSARSVDNIAPSAPLLLAIHESGNDAVLTWKPVEVPDLSHYTLYRANANGVRAIVANFLIDATLPNHTDAGAAPGNYYYVVTATDIHGNESSTSNEVSLSGSTGVNDTPALTSLMVRPNAPNPFSTRTELNLGLPGEGDVSLELFDIAGHRVLSRRLGSLQKGWQKVEFDAVDDGGKPLSSGIYFYRVSRAGKSITNKLVIAR